MCGKAQKHRCQKTSVWTNNLTSILLRAKYNSNDKTIMLNIFCIFGVIYKMISFDQKSIKKGERMYANTLTAIIETIKLDVSLKSIK